jgi:hypothetical protein
MYEVAFQAPGESYESTAGFEFSGQQEFGNESYENEAEVLEAEFASELLEISNEAELDRFLGKLVGSVVKGASGFIKSPIGKALGGVLKSVAKNTLPMVGGALGSMVLPGVGTALGSKLGSMAGGLLEAEEVEMLGEAEAEYQAAQRYVRFARSAIGNSARAPRNVPPRTAVRAASIAAARRHAPSLLKPDERMPPWRQRRSNGARRRPAWAYDEPPPWWGGYPNGGYAGDGYAGGNGAEPEPWSGNGFDFAAEAGAQAGRQAGAATGGTAGAGAQAAEGRWVRRGNRVILLGA